MKVFSIDIFDVAVKKQFFVHLEETMHALRQKRKHDLLATITNQDMETYERVKRIKERAKVDKDFKDIQDEMMYNFQIFVMDSSILRLLNRRFKQWIWSFRTRIARYADMTDDERSDYEFVPTDEYDYLLDTFVHVVGGPCGTNMLCATDPCVKFVVCLENPIFVCRLRDAIKDQGWEKDVLLNVCINCGNQKEQLHYCAECDTCYCEYCENKREKSEEDVIVKEQ